MRKWVSKHLSRLEYRITETDRIIYKIILNSRIEKEKRLQFYVKQAVKHVYSVIIKLLKFTTHKNHVQRTMS
jgi:hypothetical protein